MVGFIVTSLLKTLSLFSNVRVTVSLVKGDVTIMNSTKNLRGIIKAKFLLSIFAFNVNGKSEYKKRKKEKIVIRYGICDSHTFLIQSLYE